MTRRRYRMFSETFKLEVLRELYYSGSSKYAISKKYSLSPSTIFKWIDTYPIDSKELSLPEEIIKSFSMVDKQPELTEVELLQQRIQELSRSLELEKMRSRAFEKMIEIAEKEEGITILKKDGAKQ